MYTGSFAASIKGIACTRGFVIFTRVRVNKHIPPFTGGGFFTLSLHRALYVAFPIDWGMPACLPPRLASNGSIPLRSTTIFFAWLSIL